MRALTIVLISVLLLECFYFVEGRRRPVVRYRPDGSCRRPVSKYTLRVNVYCSNLVLKNRQLGKHLKEMI
uniref:Putative 5.3 kDa protein n=1 Tax=Ixodes ricinus TaxID=34613 RepID=A0A0K8RNI7_IXORI